MCLPWSKSTSLSGSFIAGFPNIRSYLRDTRGISDYVIDRHLLGWNGFGIIVPIIDRDGNPTFRKLAKDPEGPSDRPKMLAPTGSHAKLYDWQNGAHET